MKWMVLFLCGALVGCMGAIDRNSERRVSSDLAVLDFNDVYDRYTPQATAVSLVDRHQSGQMLSIFVDLYGRNSHLYIPEERADEVVPLIEKYLEWESMASERGDQLEKEIGVASGWTGFKLQTKFFSAGAKDHLLVIRQCVLSCGSSHDDTFYFDRAGAVKLLELLDGLKSHSLAVTDDSVYQ